MKFGNHCAELQRLNENFSGTKGWLPGGGVFPWCSIGLNPDVQRTYDGAIYRAILAGERNVDVACAEAEEDPELSGSGIARRRAEICDQAMIKLANFKPFDIAEKALARDIDALEGLEDRNPQQVQMLVKLKQARVDLQEGVEATKRLVMERCKMRESVSL